MGVFSKQKDYVEGVKRNTFDMSFQNNLTMNFGGLYPVVCQEVLPGDSCHIVPTFALKTWPMLFPVQTRMRAYLHFFFVRNRNLWKDWPDFIGRTKDGLELPYIAPSDSEAFDKVFGTGSLGDYLGIPTTAFSSDSFTPYSGVFATNVLADDGDASKLAVYRYTSSESVPGKFVPNEVFSWMTSNLSNKVCSLFNPAYETIEVPSIASKGSVDGTVSFEADDLPVAPESGICNEASFVRVASFVLPNVDIAVDQDGTLSIPIEVNYTSTRSFSKIVHLGLMCYLFYDESGKPVAKCCNYGATGLSDIYMTYEGTEGTANNKSILKRLIGVSASFKCSKVEVFSVFGGVTYDASGSSLIGICLGYQYSTSGNYFTLANGCCSIGYANSPDVINIASVVLEDSSAVLSLPDSIDLHEISYNNSPYYTTGGTERNPQMKLSALPFRAYESIYNAFYRDTTNNPYMIDGQPEYNKWIPSVDGGADSNAYALRYRNWEQDFLTTAKQSPQQGIAPLVGISSTGEMTFADEEGNTYKAQATFSDDGKTITGFKVQSPDMPAGTLRSLVDAVSSGISINDLRNVNALQRWLEANIRRGLRYREQIKSHFNVDTAYQTLDMPEFIGGIAEDIFVNQVTQTTPPASEGDTPLGWFAGQGNLVKTSKRPISKYFDEHGYLIGILSVVPVPNYSQLMPKHFLKRDTLDYYFPEFGHIGYQPIFYNEVCPIQAYNEGLVNSKDKLLTTFGYQRAWYDYVANVDTVHGLYRTSLRNFLLNRVFESSPELSEEFLEVRPSQLNDIFAVSNAVSDKILGQVYFDMKMKRPIPVIGIPALDSHNLP